MDDESTIPPSITRLYTWFSALVTEDYALLDDLLAHGVPVDVPHPLRHTTALMEATRLGRIGLVQWLLTHGAAPAFLCGMPKGTPIHAALRRHDWAIARPLINACEVCSATDGYGRSPLHMLAMESPDAEYGIAQALELANRLIKRQCPLDALDREGVTALHYCAIHDFPQLAELLLICGADPNTATPDRHVTPLIIAALEGNITLAQLLVQHGADPHHATKDGSTPLSIMPRLSRLIGNATLAVDGPPGGKHPLPSRRLN
jgi:ankyrin repeat protein